MFSKRLDVDNLDGVLECYEALESKLSEEVDCASLLIILAYLYDLTKGYKNAFIPTTTVENPTNYTSDIKTIQNTGGNQPHNNVQPSKIVNRWHRTA